MKRNSSFIISLALMIFLIISVNGLTQDNTEKEQNSTSESEDAVIPDKVLGEESLDTGDFVYKPKGRRDPFQNLLKGKNVKVKREAGEGIASLLIDELELEGILLKEGKYIALFKGPDSKPYDVRVGESVYDGEIIDITPNSVVFKRILTMATLGGQKEKLIIKPLIPEEEASKK